MNTRVRNKQVRSILFSQYKQTNPDLVSAVGNISLPTAVTYLMVKKTLRANAEHFDHQHGTYKRTDCLTCNNFLCLLAACGKIHKFLQLLAVRFSTSCSLLRLDFQLLAFRMCLRVNRKDTTFLLLAGVCVFLRCKNFLHHFLRVHYFWAVPYAPIHGTLQSSTHGFAL